VISFTGQGILLDVEGTTSSIRFVYEVLFPFARQQLVQFLATNWDRPDVRRACEQIAKDASDKSLAQWTDHIGPEPARQKVIAEVNRLMDGNVKATGLKELQGLIWKEGYESGKLVSHVYADVPAALRAWHETGLDVRIYSSGSITAQKQFFRRTEHGDLTGYFRGHYDTTIGPKRNTDSYRAIAADMRLPPAQILFCSDVLAELDAAHAAGMKTALAMRTDNAPITDHHVHPVITSFDQIKTKHVPASGAC
jgi:enolase-phosphatase E1